MTGRQYLGDGLYVEWNGERIILSAENGISATDTIYLDGDTWAALVDYIDRLRTKARS